MTKIIEFNYLLDKVKSGTATVAELNAARKAIKNSKKGKNNAP